MARWGTRLEDSVSLCPVATRDQVVTVCPEGLARARCESRVGSGILSATEDWAFRAYGSELAKLVRPEMTVQRTLIGQALVDRGELKIESRIG